MPTIRRPAGAVPSIECVDVPKGHKPCTCGSKIKAKKCCFTPAKLAEMEKERKRLIDEDNNKRQRAVDAHNICRAATDLLKLPTMARHGEALELFAQSAELGSVLALCCQASMLGKGDGVPMDVPAAAKLYEKGAKMGSVSAMYGLAHLLDKGAEGIDQDAPRAVELYQQAIDDCGDTDSRGTRHSAQTDSMYNLGFLLEKGCAGVPRDVPRAVGLYQQAIDKGLMPEMAAAALRELAQGGRPCAAATAANNLAHMLVNGVDVTQDIPAGMELFRRASSFGHVGAEANLRQVKLKMLRFVAPNDKMAIAKATRETAIALKGSLAQGKFVVGHDRALAHLHESYTCDHCGKTKTEAGVEKFKKCGQCLIARYCSKECSKAAFPAHREECALAKAERVAEEEEENAKKEAERAARIEDLSLGFGNANVSCCDHCGKTTEDAGIKKFKKCGECLTARYCGRECATAGWKAHSRQCKLMKEERLAREEAEAEAEAPGRESDDGSD